MAAAAELPNRWEGVQKILRRNSPFAGPGFAPDTAEKPEIFGFLRDLSKVLVIGAGGLGCELLKDLALMGFRNIDVIDMDTIDVSNLNRQFLFRKADVGQPKAVVAAKFINSRIPGVTVTAYTWCLISCHPHSLLRHYCKIQDKDDDWYRQFQIIVCGLDNIDARRWMNSTLINMVEMVEDPSNPDAPATPDELTIIPMIDGGTEGFRGQARVIIPRKTACFECTIDAFPPQKTYPLCTLAATPRIPEHCIQWASLVQWDKVKAFGVNKDGKPNPVDTDEPAHMNWLFEQATARAAEHNISGVTFKLVQGVVKNIIPAIASTNAVVAASCANEAFKIATSAATYMNNYMMYMGNDGLYTDTYAPERKPTCPACGTDPIKLTSAGQLKLAEFLDVLRTHPDLQLKRPSIRIALEDGKTKNVYMQAPPQLHELTKPNLERHLNELFHDGESLAITDPSLANVGVSVILSLQ
jgi:ubiquitin-activating enzyme E1 C